MQLDKCNVTFEQYHMHAHTPHTHTLHINTIIHIHHIHTLHINTTIHIHCTTHIFSILTHSHSDSTQPVVQLVDNGTMIPFVLLVHWAGVLAAVVMPCDNPHDHIHH